MNGGPALNVGDEIVTTCDVLVEIARSTPASPAAWRFLPSGTRGKLLGWRDRPEESKVVVDVAGTDRRLVVFVAEEKVSTLRSTGRVMRRVRD